MASTRHLHRQSLLHPVHHRYDCVLLHRFPEVASLQVSPPSLSPWQRPMESRDYITDTPRRMRMPMPSTKLQADSHGVNSDCFLGDWEWTEHEGRPMCNVFQTGQFKSCRAMSKADKQTAYHRILCYVYNTLTWPA